MLGRVELDQALRFARRHWMDAWVVGKKAITETDVVSTCRWQALLITLPGAPPTCQLIGNRHADGVTGSRKGTPINVDEAGRTGLRRVRTLVRGVDGRGFCVRTDAGNGTNQ